MESTNLLVAFDESGNTGQNLMDASQPVFVLASVCLPEQAALELAALATPAGTVEAKFSRLRSSNLGQKRLVKVLESELLNPQNAKLSVYHKGFLIMTKIVDMLMETMHHQMGHNLYAQRANLGLANMWHHVMPTFCGPAEYERLQLRFQVMVREGTPGAIDEFYSQVERMREANSNADFDLDLRTLGLTRMIVDDALSSEDRTALDPALPAFFDLAAQWTAQLNRPFDIAHDRSKPIAAQRENLELLMSTAYPPWVSPGDGPSRQLPLLATGVTFAESGSIVQIQIADLLAGAAACFMGTRARSRSDSLANKLQQTRLPELLSAGTLVWPDTSVTTEDLGRGDDGAALQMTMDIAAAERARRSRAPPQ